MRTQSKPLTRPHGRLTLARTLFAAAAGLATAAGAQPVDNAIRVTMPVLPRIDGCMAPGGLQRITDSDEPGVSVPFWCGTPPECLTVLPGAFNGTSHFCKITPYSRREPRGNPIGAPGANGIRDPEDLTCEAGLLIGDRPQAGICPPVPATPLSGSAWWGASPYTSGTVMVLYWSGVNATAAQILGCTSGMSASGQAPTSSRVDGPMYGGTIQCTVRFSNASGQTADAVAIAYEDTSGAPAPPPICTPPQVFSGGTCVAPPPAPTPPPGPICPVGTALNVISGVCEPNIVPPPPPPPPAPIPANCTSTAAMVPALYYEFAGYSTNWWDFGQAVYNLVNGSVAVGSLPTAPDGSTFGVAHTVSPNDPGATCWSGLATYQCFAPSWSLTQNFVSCEGQSAP